MEGWHCCFRARGELYALIVGTTLPETIRMHLVCVRVWMTVRSLDSRGRAWRTDWTGPDGMYSVQYRALHLHSSMMAARFLALLARCRSDEDDDDDDEEAEGSRSRHLRFGEEVSSMQSSRMTATLSHETAHQAGSVAASTGEDD